MLVPQLRFLHGVPPGFPQNFQENLAGWGTLRSSGVAAAAPGGCHCPGGGRAGGIFTAGWSHFKSDGKKGALRYHGHREKPQDVNPGEIQRWMGSPPNPALSLWGDSGAVGEGNPTSDEQCPVLTPRGCRCPALLSLTHGKIQGRFGVFEILQHRDQGRARHGTVPSLPQHPRAQRDFLSPPTSDSPSGLQIKTHFVQSHRAQRGSKPEQLRPGHS